MGDASSPANRPPQKFPASPIAPRTVQDRFWHVYQNGLWAEALRLVFGYWRNWAIGWLLFVALSFALDTFAPKLRADGLVLVLDALLQAGAGFVFCVAFLNQEPIGSGPVRVTMLNTVRALACLALVAALGMAALAAWLFLCNFLGEIMPTLSAFWLDAIKQIGGGVITLVLMLRWVGVLPYAVNGFDRSLRRSWQVTRGKVIRLGVNLAMLTLLLSPFLVGLHYAARPWGDPVGQCLYTLFSVAFACAVTRALHGEFIAAQVGDRRGAARA